MEIYADLVICSESGVEFIREDERYPDDMEKVVLCLLTHGALLIEEYDAPITRSEWEAICNARNKNIQGARERDIAAQRDFAKNGPAKRQPYHDASVG